MKKFKVDYTSYDNSEWRHSNLSTIIEAESKEQAKQIVEDRTNIVMTFYVDHIEEIVE